MQINITEARRQFRIYLADVRSQLRAEGMSARVDADTEWAAFLATQIAEGNLPATAAGAPRNAERDTTRRPACAIF